MHFVFYDPKDRFFYLENRTLTFALRVNEFEELEEIYFGRKVGRELFPQIVTGGRFHGVYAEGDRNKTFDRTQTPFAVPASFGANFHEPMLSVRLADGVRRLDLKYLRHRVCAKKPLCGMPCVRDGETLEIDLQDPAAPELTVTVSYSVQPDAASVQSSVLIRNTGFAPVTIERAFSFSLQLPDLEWDSVVLHGYGGGGEGQIERRKLGHGGYSVGSRRGNSSAVLNPSLILCESSASEEAGLAYGVTLVYSGSHRILAELLPWGEVRLTGGIQDQSFSWLLEPGDSFQTPEAILCFSEAGVGGLSRVFHDVLRDHLIPKAFAKAPRPIVLNNWEGTHFSFTGEKLRAMVDRVAGTGIDTFVLDDGWFGKRNSARSGLGDWFVNEEKLGGTLREFIDYVHGKGMKFGLWFEPEMISRDSDLYRAHPDWAICDGRHEPVEMRYQLVLDLGRRDVRDDLVRRVNAILSENSVDYVKWDMNRDLTEGFSSSLPAERQGESEHRQILGLYDLFERIVCANPGILFEGCASGGGRFDAGILAYFPQIWASDNTDAYSRARIQYGTTLIYPPSALSCHVTASPNARGAHFVPMKTRAALAHFGATGYELDVTKMSGEDLDAIPDQVREYRDWEDLVLTGDLYRLRSPYDGEESFVQTVSKDRTRSRLTLFRGLWYSNAPTPSVRLRGLDPNARYRCPELGKTLYGSTLMAFGFRPNFSKSDADALVYHFETESKSEIDP